MKKDQVPFENTYFAAYILPIILIMLVLLTLSAGIVFHSAWFFTTIGFILLFEIIRWHLEHWTTRTKIYYKLHDSNLTLLRRSIVGLSYKELEELSDVCRELRKENWRQPEII